MKSITGFLVGILMMISVIVALGGLASNMSTTHNVSVNTTFVDDYNKMDFIVDQSENMSSQVQGSQPDSELQAWASKGIWSALKMPFETIGVVHEFLVDFVDYFQMPHWIVSVIYAAMFIIPLVFGIVVATIAKRVWL